MYIKQEYSLKCTETQPQELLRAASELVPVLRERGAEISRARSIPGDIIDLLTNAGLMQLLRPAKYGLQMDSGVTHPWEPAASSHHA